MSFQKTGNFLRGANGQSGEKAFAGMVASVLRERFGDRPAAVEVVARWTGANERTVKNWFGGHCAPRGYFFRSLVLHCPEMLDAFLLSVGGGDRMTSVKLMEAQCILREASTLIETLTSAVSDAS